MSRTSHSIGRMSLLIARAAFFLFLCLAGCASVHQEPAGPPAVAVWDLEDLSYGTGAAPDIGQVLAGQVIEIVRQQGQLPVVERQKLMAVLEELNLGSSALADEGTRLRVGRVSGARQMVFGSYQVAGNSVRIDLRLVDVETGRLLRAGQQTATAGDIGAWLDAASKAASELFPRAPGG